MKNIEALTKLSSKTNKKIHALLGYNLELFDKIIDIMQIDLLERNLIHKEMSNEKRNDREGKTEA